MRWSRWYRLVIAREVLCWKGCRSVGGEFSDEVTELWVKELMCLDGRIGNVLPLIIGG